MEIKKTGFSGKSGFSGKFGTGNKKEKTRWYPERTKVQVGGEASPPVTEGRQDYSETSGLYCKHIAILDDDSK